MSISEARAALPRVVDLVIAGHEITLTRHGKPVAVIVRPDALRARRAEAAFAAAAEIRAMLEKARHTKLDDAPGLTNEQAEALIAEIRADRDGR
jgi:antitoxin (DNA-binding transcriptional repressor) of toxin-antitoxin stability system